MEQVKQVIENRKCYNAKRGCKFQTKWYYCTCCMMHFAIGTDFFDYYARLQREDSNFMFTMTDWQRENFERDYAYQTKWCNNFPKGAIA